MKLPHLTFILVTFAQKLVTFAREKRNSFAFFSRLTATLAIALVTHARKNQKIFAFSLA